MGPSQRTGETLCYVTYAIDAQEELLRADQRPSTSNEALGFQLAVCHSWMIRKDSSVLCMAVAFVMVVTNHDKYIYEMKILMLLRAFLSDHPALFVPSVQNWGVHSS